MKISKFTNENDWLDFRKGRITGTSLKDLINKRATKPKIGFYSIIADRIAIPASDENRMDRGKRLEEYAIERFSKDTGKKVDGSLIMWVRDDNENIAISPDGVIGKTEAVEVKCLSSARHIEAYLTQQIPSEYEYQVIQYFVVNEKLKKLYFVFFDPRMPKDYFHFVVERKDIQDKIDECLEIEKEVLESIKKIEKDFTF